MKNTHNILLVLGLSLLFSCSKDLGNYDYQKEMERGSFEIIGIDGAGIVEAKEEVDFIAALEYPSYRDKNDFKSYWIIHRKGDKRLVDTLGTGEHLSYVVDLPIGEYVLEYMVNDSVFDVQYTEWVGLTVSGAPDGWMFLEKDAAGMADISMYGYDSKRKRMYATNMLSNSGVTDEMRRNVTGIHSTSGTQMNVGNYGLWIEGEKTYLLEPDNGFYFDSTYLSDFSLGESEAFEGKKIIRSTGNQLISYVFGNDKIYQSMGHTSLYLSELSTYWDGEQLPIASLFAPGFYVSNGHIVFETKNNRFMQIEEDGIKTLSSYAGFPEGDKALYFSQSRSEKYKALMKSLTGNYDVPTGLFYELQFSVKDNSGGVAKRTAAISAEELHNLNEESCVEYTIFSHPFGQLYYSNGGELYTGIVNDNKYKEVPVTFSGERQLEGDIVCLYCHRFRWLYGTEYSFPEFRENAEYLVISTKKSDGTGGVYFGSIKSNEPHIITLKKKISTSNPVYSITFSERRIN